MCKKYMHHGTSKGGCRLGKKCEHVHPKMCYSSLEKGECFKRGCSYYHVRGTKFDNTESTSRMQHSKNRESANPRDRGCENHSNSDNVCDHNENAFLSQTSESLATMKAELIEAIDSRLITVLSTLQMQNQSMIVPPPRLGFSPVQPPPPWVQGKHLLYPKSVPVTNQS